MKILQESISIDNKYQVEIVDYDHEPFNRLWIYHIDSILEEHFDGSEDNSFNGGYDWIPRTLVDAYNYGYEDGYNQALKDV